MGFMRIVRIMGKSWGVMRYPVGLHGSSGDGGRSITSAAIPRAVKQPCKYNIVTPTRVPPAVKRGSGGEHCGGTTQLSPPDAASRGEVFCKSFRRKAGRFVKILRRIFDHRHPHTAGTKSDAPGRTGRGGLGAAEAPKKDTHEPDSSYRKVR